MDTSHMSEWRITRGDPSGLEGVLEAVAGKADAVRRHAELG